MPNTAAWDKVPVHAWYYKSPGVPDTGEVDFKIAGAPNGVKRADGTAIYRSGATIKITIGDPAQQDGQLLAALKTAYRARAQAAAAAKGETFNGTAWDAQWAQNLPAMVCTGFYAQDDPDITPNTGWQVQVTERLSGGTTGPYPIPLTVAMIDASPLPGLNLSSIEIPPGTPFVPAPTYAKGQPGGVAGLDADGDVLNAAGMKVVPGAGGGGAVGSVAGKTGDVTLALADIVGLVTALNQKAPNASPTFTGTVTGVTKAMVGLGNVNDTSDANKPVSNATAAALALKADLVNGLIPTNQLPPLAINETFPVASQAAMLALTAQRGDIAIRSDVGKTFILATDSPGTLADWKEVMASGQVVSVAGRTGVISLGIVDISGLQAALDAKGTSNLTLGTTGSTAKPGDWKPAAGDIPVLTLAQMPPGGMFGVDWNGTAWTYNGATITTRPSARTDIKMMAIGNTTRPSFGIAGVDLWMKEVP